MLNKKEKRKKENFLKKVLKIEKKRLTLFLLNGIMFKLSISESVILIATNCRWDKED